MSDAALLAMVRRWWRPDLPRTARVVWTWARQVEFIIAWPSMISFKFERDSDFGTPIAAFRGGVVRCKTDHYVGGYWMGYCAQAGALVVRRNLPRGAV